MPDSRGDPTGGLIPGLVLHARDMASGIGVALALGVVAGAFPALRAMRLRIADALRRS
jgi:putative ABC transport system permease protein